jgi:TonB family protein
MVAHVDNDNALAFLIGAGSKPYMTISINMKGGILATWGDESKRTMYTCTSMTELKKAILDRYNVGDKPKAGEMYHVEFDVATPKASITALKSMLLGLGVSQCELTGIRDMANHRTPPSPPKAITQADVLKVQEDTPSAAPTTPTATANTDEVYNVVEEQPEYPGGMGELMKFLQVNIRYPKEAQARGIQGRVIVQFVVNSDGSICDEKLIKSVDPQLDAEALRIVRSMPTWTPGKQRGQAVRVRFTLPVTFRLSN